MAGHFGFRVAHAAQRCVYLGKVRRLRLRDKLSINEICRRSGLARNTVKRWLKAGEGATPKYRRTEGVMVLQPDEDRLRLWLWLEADLRRSKRDRRTALALFDQLKLLGFEGSYSRVSEYVRRDPGIAGRQWRIVLAWRAGEISC